MSNDIFKERESKLIEFKSAVPRPHFDALIKTCIAFANGAGGKIVIGVDDKTHKVIGVTDSDRETIYEDFPNSLYDQTSPSVIAQIYEQSFDGKTALIIEVPLSPRKPYFLKNKGPENGTYIRVGSSTRKATPEYIEDLVLEAQRLYYDETIIHVSTGALSNELIKQFYSARVTKKRLLADQIIVQMPANKEYYAPTVTGILMFCENPEDYIPEALIRCTRFQGVSGRNIMRSEDITGTIEQQATNCLKLIKSWLMSDYVLQGIKLSGSLPVPETALREAILNALFHRKYSIPGATKIAIYDDRMEIFSPGGFPGLIDINNLGDGTTFLRNPHLTRLAYQVKLIETRGTGVKLIYESCAEAGIKKPEYQESGDFVKVIFYFEPDAMQHKTEEEAILAYLDIKPEVTAHQLSEYLDISHNSALRKLKSLIEKKKVRKLGKGPNVRYQKP